MRPCISLKNVYFRYSEKAEWSLNGITLHIMPGEWITILGGNGSGKSTLARLINGLYIPTDGKVLVFDKDTGKKEDQWEIRQRVGMVFQNPDNQTVMMTVEDEVAFGPENLGLPPAEIERRTEWAIGKLDLDSIKHLETASLTPGQKQKLAIAAVLAMEPDAVIFDEATSMLDPEAARDVLSIMSEMHREGKTIIHITHEMEELQPEQRIVVLRDGMVILDGSPRKLLSDANRLREAGLMPPFAVRFREAFKKAALPVESDIMTVEELTEQIWTLLSGK